MNEILFKCLLGAVLFFNTDLYSQPNYNTSADSTKEEPTQYRRGIEVREGYQSYEEKYSGKNLNEEKRSLFPLRNGTGVWTELSPDAGENWFAQLNAGVSVIFQSIHFVDSLYGWTALV
jgi:hypothetical protein